MLARIRSALKTPAPRHDSAAEMAAIFATVRDPLARFQKECTANSTECIPTPNVTGAEEVLRGVLASVPRGEVYVQDAPVLHRIVQGWNDRHGVRWSSEGPPGEASVATVTTVECLIASIGSMLLASSAGGRGASIVAPVHVAVASESQLEPDLESALARVKRSGLAERSSSLFLITGSSRTADIEKILVLGAHGPRRLIVVLARNLD